MADIQKKFLCPRLVDYLAVVGARPSPQRTANNASPPVQYSCSTSDTLYYPEATIFGRDFLTGGFSYCFVGCFDFFARSAAIETHNDVSHWYLLALRSHPRSSNFSDVRLRWCPRRQTALLAKIEKHL
ncbi:hypothetical protein J6590_102561 [Homalodisca vitripennis]|nr:hypothetical protein J6590_102561 [Homalodisca vitripennis]